MSLTSSQNQPGDQFRVFEPNAEQGFEDRWVSHLFRRAGFGASAEELDRFKGKSVESALGFLMDYDPGDDPMGRQFEEMVGFINPNNPSDIQNWWLHRMLHSPRAMQEKIALFWHGRFATSLGKVEQPMWMNRQIDLFRKHGMGNYRQLLIEVGHDPAMLVWLDGRFNRKGKPNENYGRELMELFTLGIGNYTEKDVKEMARCFTGWQVKESEAVFTRQQFDDGEKTILGETGDFDSESAIDVILKQPAASKFLAKHLLLEFVHPEPVKEQVEHYAQRLVECKWEIKPVLREMLSSRMFFSEWAYRSKIKSPVELVVGACHAIGGKVSDQFLREQTSKMGQAILYPPSVKGWDGQEMWINANTVLLRFNVGFSLSEQRNNEYAVRADIEGDLARHKIRTGQQIVDHFARVMLDGKVDEEARKKLLDYLKRDTKGKNSGQMMGGGMMMADEAANTGRVRGMLHLMMSMSEYQLA